MGRAFAGAWATSLVLLALAGCGKDQQGATVQQTPVAAPILSHSDQLLLAAAMIALPPAGVQPGDLPDPRAQGAQLEAKYCAQCHSLPAPAMHSATDWPIVVRRMWLRMEWLPDSLGVKSPAASERYEILQCLTANALKVSGSALPPGRGRDVFGLVCSRCHALPDPRDHAKTDWPIVFARMERNMERMKVAPPTADQTQQVLGYLQTAAAAGPARRARRR
jgi:mono/diheme cytochrome c family protein